MDTYNHNVDREDTLALESANVASWIQKHLRCSAGQNSAVMEARRISRSLSFILGDPSYEEDNTMAHDKSTPGVYLNRTVTSPHITGQEMIQLTDELFFLSNQGFSRPRIMSHNKCLSSVMILVCFVPE